VSGAGWKTGGTNCRAERAVRYRRLSSRRATRVCATLASRPHRSCPPENLVQIVRLSLLILWVLAESGTLRILLRSMCGLDGRPRPFLTGPKDTTACRPGPPRANAPTLSEGSVCSCFKSLWGAVFYSPDFSPVQRIASPGWLKCEKSGLDSTPHSSRAGPPPPSSPAPDSGEHQCTRS
jgi:hypothetical protein